MEMLPITINLHLRMSRLQEGKKSPTHLSTPWFIVHWYFMVKIESIQKLLWNTRTCLCSLYLPISPKTFKEQKRWSVCGLPLNTTQHIAIIMFFKKQQKTSSSSSLGFVEQKSRWEQTMCELKELYSGATNFFFFSFFHGWNNLPMESIDY